MCKTIGFVQNIEILLTDYNNNSLICTIYGKHLFDEEEKGAANDVREKTLYETKENDTDKPSDFENKSISV